MLTIRPVADIGYLILGRPNPIFVETEAAARAIVDCSRQPPDQVIRVHKTHLIGAFQMMALNHDVILTAESRMRYHSDPEFARKLVDAL